MSCWLRQSTAADVMLGPFLDSSDGNTVEGALTITQPDIRLSKNGGAFAQKSAAQTLTHGENGWYAANLSTTDTNTLGVLVVAIHESGALPVWREFMVVPANVYDSFFSTDFLQVDLTQLLGSAVATPTVAGVIESDVTHYLGAAAPALVSSNYPANVSTVSANVINDAAVAADMDAYHAKVWVVRESTTADHYAVVFFKNGQPVTTGITSPTIQVIKASDGTDLIASGALTEVGALGIYKKDESTNKMAGGAIYFAKVQATIDGSTRQWLQQIGRDSV